MRALGPFETNPHIAVAVSGGPDSISLALLLADWVRGQGGRLEALTVDHGLRPESGVEAAAAARFLRGPGVRHHVLRWTERKPESGIQQAAREARYALMFDWCSRAGILHLLVAHHREDQAETFVMRVGRGSGRIGLAAMSPIVEHRGVRLLRPCLGVARNRLRATLEAAGAEAVSDPSNEDRRFARVRVRQSLPTLAAQGLPPGRLADAAAGIAGLRRDGEAAVARALAAATSLHPSGYAVIRTETFRKLPRRVRSGVLEAVLCTVGGSEMPPRRRRLDRLQSAIEASGGVGPGSFAGATLAGCRILPLRGDLIVCREPAAAIESIVVHAGSRVVWDRRFEMTLSGGGGPAEGEAVGVGCLGNAGWSEIVALAPELRKTSIPWPARPGLPVLRDREGVLEAPHLAYRRPDAGLDTVRVEKILYRPVRPLAGPGFMLV